MKIRQRKQEATEMEGEPIKEVLDNKLELIKFTSQVQSRIKNDITEDYTLAVLEEKDKEFIMEMTKNAYFAKKIIMRLLHKKEWSWNKERREWVLGEMTKARKDIIKQIAEQTFDAFAIGNHMITVLNRNKADNHLVMGLMGVQDDPEMKDDVEKESRSMIRKLLKPTQKEEP